ncbi:hypothetical protein AYO43_03805 [Nitrospira sp. SCGC AG-212-E16]|nr:hypothetical protein AYO43_03805 [Nitrospira sp. SCGC AG-212-E16]
MMTPEEYEQLTSQIAGSIYTAVEGITPEQVLFGRCSKWVGQSGYEHQIDVTVRGPNDAILVECKYWQDPVPPEGVLTFIARLLDIRPTFAGVIHGVIVTKSGLTSGAGLLARHYETDTQVIPGPEAFGVSYKKLRLISPAIGRIGIECQVPKVNISENEIKD